MSSKRSVVLARIKQSVGIGRHTQDNEVSEAVARLTAVSKAVSVLQAQVREMKAAFSTIGAVRSILMENILRTGGADDPGASETGARVRAVVASYKHLDGDLASALGAVFDSVVVGEVDAWAERVGALMEQVEQHNTNKLKCVLSCVGVTCTHKGGSLVFVLAAQIRSLRREGGAAACCTASADCERSYGWQGSSQA